MGYTGTTNYGFQKPAKENAFTVDDLNNALDKIDETIKARDDAQNNKNTEQDTAIANNDIDSINLSVVNGNLTVEVGKAGGEKVSDTVELPGGTITTANIPSFYQFATASDWGSGNNQDMYTIETRKEASIYIKDGSLTGIIIDVATTKVNVTKLPNRVYWSTFDEITFPTDKVQTMMETILESFDNVSCDVEACLAFTRSTMDKYVNGDYYGGEELKSYKITCKKTNGVVSNISSNLPTSNIAYQYGYINGDNSYTRCGLLIKSLLIY